MAKYKVVESKIPEIRGTIWFICKDGTSPLKNPKNKPKPSPPTEEYKLKSI
jgi:hypothetical protein